MSATRPTADVDVCNLSLDLLNQSPITSIDTPNSKAAEACARWYHMVRASLLRKHPWNFATLRTTLASVAVTIPFGYQNAFQLPDNFLRLVGLGDDETGALTSDSGALFIRYIYDIVDVGQFDPIFVELLVHEIAIKIAPKFSASEARLGELKEEVRRIMPTAYAVDGQERPPTRITRSKWIGRRKMNAHRGFGSKYITFDQELPSPIRYQLEDGYIFTGAL